MLAKIDFEYTPIQSYTAKLFVCVPKIEFGLHRVFIEDLMPFSYAFFANAPSSKYGDLRLP